MKVLCELLNRLAKLYQIKEFDSSVVLASWILTNYKYERLESITRCLENPPALDEKIWRLTPDVIQSWFMAYLDKLSNAREREIHNAKHEKVESEWQEDRLKELHETIKAVEDFKVPAITEEDILAEGQEKPKRRYVPPDKEYLIMQQMRQEYGRKWCHLHTGRPLPGAPSFEEFLALNR